MKRIFAAILMTLTAAIAVAQTATAEPPTYKPGKAVKVDIKLISGPNDTGFTGSLVSYNGEKVPLSITTDTPYRGAVTTTLTQGGQVITRKMETITTGTKITVMPQVLNQESIIMALTIDHAKLVEMKHHMEGNHEIDTPTLANFNYKNTLILRDGVETEIPMSEGHIAKITAQRI